MRHDIVIIGGGIIGSSIAYHLANAGAGDVAVIERDPTYEIAATPRGSGGIRQLFSLPENVAMTRHGLPFYECFDEIMAVDGESPAISFRRQGYLFVSDGGDAATMEANFRNQETLGVAAELLDGPALERLFPSIRADDVDIAVYSPNDAWIDAYAALQGFRRKARSLGVTYLQDEVATAEITDGKVGAILCASGERIEADLFVLATGAWSGEVGHLFGVDLPVEPMSRESYFFRCEAELEPLPFIKSETDLAFRPEGAGYTGGVPDWSVPAGWNWELDPNRFEEVVWPALAHRVPAMETLRMERGWRGHYARNSLDKSAIIGRWEGEPANLFIATGFSGHGIMHAPATGLAMAELILGGRFETMDLARFGTGRILRREPYAEMGIV
ncbi:MAG: FAD-binding oxidoreductase [Alphaproteobacteria bacterium]|jgi:FAD-dependent oxidoreductase domain-containing protein 1|nr:FAD-binding oxidoreductase [Alphaproteobacteria bacterium]